MASATSPRLVALPLILTTFAALAGLAAYQYPPLGLALGAATLLVGIGLLQPGRLTNLFAGGLAFILIGYAFLGRPFAYLGMPPVHLSELVLGVAILAAIFDRQRFVAFRSPLAWLLIGFMAWGALRTLPYLAPYGIMALRDAVIWGYAAFALLLVPMLLHRRRIERLPGWFARLIPWFLAWAPIAFAIGYLAGPAMPRMPGTDIGLLSLKSGDLGTHLGGVAAFLLLGLGSERGPSGARLPGGGRRWMLWTLWFIAFVAAASLNRGGMLAGIAAIGIVMAVQPLVSARRIAKVAAIVLAVLSAAVVFDIAYQRGAGQREISPQQVAINLISLAGESPQRGLDDTAEWRLSWWNTIIDYTVRGPYFWTGKGFGINLAIDDGIAREALNRNPHNGHLTVLARSGVPGFALWALLQTAFAIAMIASYVRARRLGQHWWADFFLWILAYWTAFLVNMSFDVFLEGPQGGIWFWCLFGTGIAASLAARSDGHGPRLPAGRSGFA